MLFVDYSYENLNICNKIILLLGVAMTQLSATLEPEKERFSVVSLLPFPLLPALIFILTYLQNQYKYLQKSFYQYYFRIWEHVRNDKLRDKR